MAIALNADMRESARLDRRTLAVVLAGFCSFVTLYAPQPLLPLLARVFGASKVGVSLTITVSTLAVAMAAPFAGLVADRLGRKRVIVPAAVLLAIPTLLAATSGSLGQLLFWRFWQGVFTPGIFAVTVAYVHEEWGESGSGAAMSAYVSGTVIGGFCGRMVSGITASHFGWRWAFLALGLLNLLGALAMWAWLPEGRGFVRSKADVSAAGTVWAHLRNPRLIATYAVGFCVLFCLLGSFTYVNFYLAAPPFHLGTAALGSLFVVYLVGAVVTPIAGRWIDRLGHRLILSLGIGSGVIGVVLTLRQNVLFVMAGLAILCTGTFVAQSAANSYIGHAAGHGRAAAVGLYVMFYYSGGSAGAAIPGYVWPLGGWPACVALIAAVQLFTVSLALAFWRAVPHAGAPAEIETPDVAV